MSEWKLFDEVPAEPLEALIGRPRQHAERQPGFAQRAKMVADLALLAITLTPHIFTVTDLGCGDGSLLAMLPNIRRWGYEIGAGDVAHAQRQGLDVRRANIVTEDALDYGDLLIASEVLEHLADPVAFLRALPDRLLVASSPSLETGEWHNPIHSWAWDLAGYRDLLERSGWRVLYQTECDGGLNSFGGVIGEQRFQAIVGAR